jgi:hypothetical protein
VHKLFTTILVLSALATANTRTPVAEIPGPNALENIPVVAAQNGLLAIAYYNAGSGQVNLYNWGTWTSAGTLVPSGANAIVQSIAIQNDYVAVGAYNSQSENQSAVYIFDRATGSQIAVLSPSDPQQFVTGFGESVAAWGETIVVGCPECGPSVSDRTGKAYVYAESNGGWKSTTETAQLSINSIPANARVGVSATVLGSVGGNGNLIALGAPAGPGSGYSSSGAVYLFGRPQSGWVTSNQPTATLSDEEASNEAEVGLSVSLGKGVLVTTESPLLDGHLLIFVEPTGGWQTNSSPLRITDSAMEAWWTASVNQGGSVTVTCCGTTYTKRHSSETDLAFLYHRSSNWSTPIRLSAYGESTTVGGAINAGDWAFLWDFYGNVFIFDGK